MTPGPRKRAFSFYNAQLAPHVIEKMLNHQMVGAMAVYNHAEYLAERREAWRLWGALVNQWRKNRPPGSSQRA